MLTNVGFYVAWAILAFLPLSITIISCYKKKTKIIACLCILVVAFGITTLLYQNRVNQDVRWNNGICECGGTYEFSAASQSIHSKTFYYTCNKCGHTEKFDTLRK